MGRKLTCLPLTTTTKRVIGADTGQRITIDGIWISLVSGGGISYRLHLVGPGETATNANVFVYDVTLTSAQRYEVLGSPLNQNLVLPEGWELWARASNTQLVLTVWGQINGPPRI